MSINLEIWPRVSRSNKGSSLITEVAKSEDFRLDSNFFFRLQYLRQSGSPLMLPEANGLEVIGSYPQASLSSGRREGGAMGLWGS